MSSRPARRPYENYQLTVIYVKVKIKNRLNIIIIYFVKML